MEEEKQQVKAPIRSVLNTYAESDSEDNEEVQRPRNEAIMHYNDLEELD